MKIVLTPLTKSVLILFRLTAAASTTDVAIWKKIYKSMMVALIISNEEMKKVILELVKYLEQSGLLVKGVSETIANEIKELNRWFLGMLLGILAGNLLENMLAGKPKIPWREVIKTGDGTIRAGHYF